MSRFALSLLTLAACNKNKDEAPPKLLDTGWFDGTTDLSCPDLVVDISPEDAASGWYWRDRPQVFTATTERAAYDAYVLDADGQRLDTQLAWDDSGLMFTVEWDGWLQASSDYTLVVTDCSDRYEYGFRTGPLGQPLQGGPDSLVGQTFLLDLEGAEWVEPPQLSSLISLYLTTPILLGVRYADEDQIIGAPGFTDPFGFVFQDPQAPSWDFPMADFSAQPFLDAQVDRVVLQYDFGSDVVDIPVEDFVLQATISADGQTMGGGVLRGVGDTRNLGVVLGDADDLGALCELAGGLGLQCIPCEDGERYCLNLAARDLTGTLMPGLVLVEQ
jgi:hypothetical protein